MYTPRKRKLWNHTDKHEHPPGQAPGGKDLQKGVNQELNEGSVGTWCLPTYVKALRLKSQNQTNTKQANVKTVLKMRKSKTKPTTTATTKTQSCRAYLGWPFWLHVRAADGELGQTLPRRVGWGQGEVMITQPAPVSPAVMVSILPQSQSQATAALITGKFPEHHTISSQVNMS